MRLDRLPLTYDECRARFRWAATVAGQVVDAHPIAARGPEGQGLSIDVVTLGAPQPTRALLLLAGVHGVEGFAGSQLQVGLLASVDPRALPDDMAVVIVHAVNPWGMAWWRRQNESNVDLNRNWGRSGAEPDHNDDYDEVHALACPDTPELPSVDDLLVQAAALVAERGLPWVTAAITAGQYRHADGLHFGGHRTEESTSTVEAIAKARLDAVERLLVVDLHTGHGPYGELTALSDRPAGSPQDAFLRPIFPNVHPTVAAEPDVSTAPKRGGLARGLADSFPAATTHATVLELGSAGDEEQLVATYHEQWVHRLGDRRRPDHAAAVWAYRCCFTPDDQEWERTVLERGRQQIGAAIDAVAAWA
ncbi:MAG: DUF2817 domain-containing protein [Acidimicrobiales bacterium]